jgi:hypothetical protein
MQNTAVATDGCIMAAKSVAALQEISSPPVNEKNKYTYFFPTAKFNLHVPFVFTSTQEAVSARDLFW